MPRSISDATLACLDRVAGLLASLGVRANVVTSCGIVLAAVAGVFLTMGWFGVAAGAMIVSSLSDALDGLVARKSRSASVGGALLDASADRYEEFFVLAGLAIYFRDSVPVLVLVLFAIAGSFMVSYGSAKAEALAVPVPPGVMRRAERAVCLCAGVGFSALVDWTAPHASLPDWAAHVPVIAAVAVLAVVANASAARRLRALARTKSGIAVPLPLPDATRSESTAPAAAANGASPRVVTARHALRIP